MADVLIVDDDEQLRLLLRSMMTEEGHVVREAADGNAALKLCEERTPDLIILDLIMPEKEGIETIIEIRRRNTTVKIIAISAAPYDLKVASMLGADYILEKPFSQASIATLVKTSLA